MAIFLLGAFVLIAPGASALTDTQAFEANIKLGLQLIDEEEYQLAVDQFKATREIAEDPHDQVVAGYYEAIALGRLERFEQALLVAEDAIGVYRDEGIDNPDLIVALYEAAAQIASIMGDEMKAAAYSVDAMKSRPIDETIWSRDVATGTLTHIRTGITFPQKIAGLQQSEIIAYEDTGRDVSASYQFPGNDRFAEITVYVTEKQLINEEYGGAGSANDYFQSSQDAIFQRFGKLDAIEEGYYSLALEPGRKLLKAFYRIDADANNPSMVTGILLGDSETYFLKFRITYGADFGLEGRLMLDRFLQAFDWPQLPAQATQ